MGNWAGMGKAHPMGNPHSRPALNYAGMGTGMRMVLEAGMGMVKQSPAPPRPIAIPTSDYKYIFKKKKI